MTQSNYYYNYINKVNFREDEEVKHRKEKINHYSQPNLQQKKEVFFLSFHYQKQENKTKQQQKMGKKIIQKLLAKV